MTVPFLDARFGECRTPRWTDATPPRARMVCGAPTLPSRSYCVDCRAVLINGVIKNGRTVWFNGATRTMEISGPVDPAGKSPRNPTKDQKLLAFDPAGQHASGSLVDDGFEEDEPDGARPLLPSDLYDVGMAA